MKKINFDKIKKLNQDRKEKYKVKKVKKNKKVNDNEEIIEKPKKVKKRRRFRIFYWLTVLIVFFALCCFIGGIGFCYYIVKSAPEFDVDKMFEKEATRIYDSKGELIATLGTEQRQKVTYEELPEVLVDAIIATEDSRFFQHNGFDAPRFIKASISQIMGKGGGGASTLTMQLSKLAFTSTESSGIEGIIRKFTDIYMSVFKMEKYFTKEEIIEYYVNTPCMGGNIYGVQQASQYYFGKDAKDLNLVEAAQIAGMFQSPNGYNPYVNPNDANERKNTVLYLMKRHGYITDSEYQAGISIEIKDLLTDNNSATANEYQGFIDTVVQEVIDRTGNNPYDVPMDIHTTMVKSKQDIINNFYKTYKFKDKKVEVGIGVIDNDTGAIIAVGAGRYKTSAMTLNVATFYGQTKRMPGSTIKPILDYGPAIEYENLSTYGPFIDEKTKYGSGYMRNFNSSYKGFMTMNDCLKNSINTCALQAFRMTTNEQKYEFATSLGIDFGDVTALPDSYSIGAFNGVSPIQLAGAFAAFGSGGYYSEPHSFTKIVYRETEEEYEPDIERTRVMKATTAYMITNVLTKATTYRVKVSGTQVATKTGTTSYDFNLLDNYGLTNSVIPDAWTSSYSPDYAIAIWYGYSDGLTADNVKNKYYLTNSHANTERLKIQATIGNKIYEKNSKFKKPGGLTTAKVELETIPAQSPSDYTPKSLTGSFMFVTGTEPSETSTRFSKLSDPSNVTYNISDNQIALSWTSPGTPSAVDTEYLTNYFNNGYTDWAEQYLSKRLSYNKSKIGNFGYAIYLTQGTDSVYVGWTADTNYTVNTSEFNGIYDGVIIKSMYSIFKSNASDGYKVTFNISGTNTGNNTGTGTNTEINQEFTEADITVNMSGLTQVLKVGSTFTELNKNYIDSIKLNDQDIKSQVTNLSVITSTITKSDGTNIAPDQITSSTGNYNVTYSISFVYNGKSIIKSVVQTITVQ